MKTTPTKLVLAQESLHNLTSLEPTNQIYLTNYPLCPTCSAALQRKQ